MSLLHACSCYCVLSRDYDFNINLPDCGYGMEWKIILDSNMSEDTILEASAAGEALAYGASYTGKLCICSNFASL